MPIVDLITPWWSASQSAEREAAFRAKHHQLFESLRRQRAPAVDRLATPPDLDRVAARAADPAIVSALQATAVLLGEQGWRVPDRVLILAGAEPGPAAEVLPDPAGSTIVLYLDRADGELLDAALVQAVAAAHRWSDPKRANLVTRVAATGEWDRWGAAGRVPLAEWIYTAGIGVHALAEWHPDWSASKLLGVPAAGYARLRQRERQLLQELDAVLNETGIGLVLRWLTDEAPPGLRKGAHARLLPQGIGRYLGWRMLTPRVARVGVLEAADQAA